MTDVFDDKNEVKPSWIKWGKVGDVISGTLADVTERESNLPGAKGEMQTIYDIKVEKGSFHDIIDGKVAKNATELAEGEVWKVGGKKGLDLRRVRLGQKIGLKYTEEVPPQTSGYNAFKLVKLYTAGEMDKEWCEANGIDPEQAPLSTAFVGK